MCEAAVSRSNSASARSKLPPVVCREGKSGESPFQAAQAFCRQMCLTPRLPDKPVYGTNDWNYAYGNNSAELIARVSGLVSELSPDSENRPYSVIDEGWAEGPYHGKFGHGPWIGNPRFGDMGDFATRLKGLGVRPGIWFRPLTPLPDSPESWRLGRDPAYLDPTIPEVLEHVASHIRALVRWGYEMIKHDFTTWDLLGRWGFEMGASPTRDGWHLHDGTRTNAEVLTICTARSARPPAPTCACSAATRSATSPPAFMRCSVPATIRAAAVGTGTGAWA
jgi:alpha-galactosidase